MSLYYIDKILKTLCFWAVTVFLAGVSPSVPAAEGGEGPVISDLKAQPDAGFPGTIYTITLQITDPQGPGDIDPTLYHVRENKEWIKVKINDAGVEGDRQKGDGIYTGKSEVPDTASMSTHRFEVHVRDRDDNHSNVLIYTFTVLQEFSI